MEVIVFWANQNYQSSAIQKNKTKTEKLSVREFCWTEKYLKIEEYVNIYNTKLFVRNYFSKYPEVQLEINFVISKMKVYLEKVFLPNIHKATSLLDLDKPQCH